jgi:Mg2+/Co2+ transporter CorB
VENISVKDLMVPLSEYATVAKGSTLFEAVQALEKAQEEFDHSQYRHRAILVLDEAGNVMGKLSHLDALRALEPEQNQTRELSELSQLGFSNKFVRDIRQKQRMQAEPLKELCRRAQELKVEDFMQATAEGQCIDREASLDLAIHQLVYGDHLSLLATENDRIVGILRLSDVFAAVYHSMSVCTTR